MISFHVFIELIAFLAALLWCGKKGNIFFVFIPFLLYTVLNEFAAYYIGYVRHKPNYFLYTIYVPLSFLFYSRLIEKMLFSQKNKQLIKISLFTGILFGLLNMTFIQGFRHFNTYTNILLSILIIVNCSVFFFDLLKNSEYVQSPVKEPSFWIIAGLLFFNFGGLVLNCLYDYAKEHRFQINGKQMYYFIFQFLNFLLYGCFIIAFRLCYKNMKFTS